VFRVEVVNVIYLLSCFVPSSLFLVLVFIPLPPATSVHPGEEQVSCSLCEFHSYRSILKVFYGENFILPFAVQKVTH